MIVWLYIYSNPQIDGKVNHHQISRDLLFHLFGDDYIWEMIIIVEMGKGNGHIIERWLMIIIIAIIIMWLLYDYCQMIVMIKK